MRAEARAKNAPASAPTRRGHSHRHCHPCPRTDLLLMSPAVQSVLSPATGGPIRDKSQNPRLSTVVRPVQGKGVAIGGNVVVPSPLHQFTPRIPALASRADLAIDDFSAQLTVAFHVCHHPDHVSPVAVGDVGAEARPSKVDLP